MDMIGSNNLQKGILKMNKVYVFKDPDGYFIGFEKTSIVKKIDKYQYQELKCVYEERYFTKGEEENEEIHSRTNR